MFGCEVNILYKQHIVQWKRLGKVKKTGRFVPNLHVVHDGKGHDKDGNK